MFFCVIYIDPAQQSQSVFNPNVNNLESHSPPKSPENGGVLNPNDPHRFSYGNKNNQQNNGGYNRNPNGSFSNKNYNNNLQSQQPRNQYGHSPQNSGQHQFNGNNMNQNQQNYQSHNAILRNLRINSLNVLPIIHREINGSHQTKTIYHHLKI